MNGVEIINGALVIIHQEEGQRTAHVVDVFHNCHTVNKPGWWVDIDGGDGPEGMMSYILEVVGEKDHRIDQMTAKVCNHVKHAQTKECRNEQQGNAKPILRCTCGSKKVPRIVAPIKAIVCVDCGLRK